MLLIAAMSILAAPAVFASIPRSEILTSTSIDFRTIEPVDVDASIDNEELLARALDRSFPASAPVDTLSESRVWVSRLERPLFHQEIGGLTRSLRQGSAVAWPEVASGSTVLTPDPLGYQDSSNLYAFCGGNPVGCRDPEGLAGYFFDGTDNDRAKMKNPTNVAKLAKNYYEATVYHEGVGSDLWTLPLGGFTGLGGQSRLEYMYRQLVQRYNAGDKNIDIFGFSRGAALGVAFANLIRERGIPDLSSARTVIVERGDRGGWKKEVVYDRYFQPQIRFLGIFDTVASFGCRETS